MEAAETLSQPTSQESPFAAALWNQQEASQRLSEDGSLWRTLGHALMVSCAGCVLFGAALGSYALTVHQVLASAIKVPLLLIGTSILCFPAFFVLHAVLSSSPLSLMRAATMQALALAVTGTSWGAFAPPLLFLVTSTAQYKLAQVLAVLIGVTGGALGLGRFLSIFATNQQDGVKRQRLVLVAYLVLFAAVGGQLAWVLRPFIGDPALPFELFRNPGGNMFTHLLSLLR
jgi:hypothetical protein